MDSSQLKEEQSKDGASAELLGCSELGSDQQRSPSGRPKRKRSHSGVPSDTVVGNEPSVLTTKSTDSNWKDVEEKEKEWWAELHRYFCGGEGASPYEGKAYP